MVANVCNVFKCNGAWREVLKDSFKETPSLRMADCHRQFHIHFGGYHYN